MDGHRFDQIICSLATSRRALFGGALAAAAGEFVSIAAEAKKKRKAGKKPRVGQPNSFGCLDTSKRCTRADQCCSGICQGKKGEKRCRAHDTGGCQAGQSSLLCGGMENIGCLTSRGGLGACHTTTGNAGYCAAQVEECVACATDRECEALFGLTAACILCPAECTATGRACAVFTP